MADAAGAVDRVHTLSGVAALARLPLLQRARDAALGRNTSCYASGYRGSPLGTLDMEIEALASEWRTQGLHFRPGLNEDIAATAAWGSQSAHDLPGALFEGVFALWYGKGPGVDRAGDVLKHANMAGTARLGGVLALCGDDHGAKSSTAAHQSEQALAAAMIPVLAPSSVQELIDFGLAGWALSRWSGCWSGLICPTDVVEQTARISLEAPALRLPDFANAPAAELVSIRGTFSPPDDERRLLRVKLPAAQQFARLAGLDRVVVPAPRARFGIITVGKAHQDTMEALALLGLDGAACAARGVALYKIGLSWPVEPEGARAFAAGLEEVLVVEEKRSFVEEQLARILYDLPHAQRPRLSGKQVESGVPLLPSDGELSPHLVASAIIARLSAQEIETPRRLPATAMGPSSALTLNRAPHFCAGCPHNVSTKVEPDQLAFGGIGCHGMAMWMPDRPTRKAVQMGGEGANWMGQAPFLSTPHAFQNLGDGTYFHSGSLAVRAAVAAGVNITYKILYNDAVAMTGGQPVDGKLLVSDIVSQLAAEGVREIVVVTGANAGAHVLPRGVRVEPREALAAVEDRLARTPGVTAIVYDQPCAAELRRKRKIGEATDPAWRVFIHEEVCEGCGDCAEQANCVAVTPVETQFGRKRAIDQSACNKDASCVRGFCPSFFVIEGGQYESSPATGGFDLAHLPTPQPAPLRGAMGVLIAGIGGTGVVSLGRLLVRAAELDGKATVALDVTGLAQKNGAVFSHLRFTERQEDLHGARLGAATADVVLACDLVVAASEPGLRAVISGRTRIVHETYVAPTAQVFADPDKVFAGDDMIAALASAGAMLSGVEAQALARSGVGDAIYANTVLLGAALQLGLLPISLAAVERSIGESGRSGRTLQALGLGRLAVHDPAQVDALAPPPAQPLLEAPLDELVRRCAAMLCEYQDGGYAERYLRTVERAMAAETRVGAAGFAHACAFSLWRLMAYKDEYEVARLYAKTPFAAHARAQFGGDVRVSVYLAPPWLAARDRRTGLPEKRKFGAWVFGLFAVLHRLRGLRGSALDPFGWQAERRLERRLITSFEEDVARLCDGLTAENCAAAIAVVDSARSIRGYGHVKLKSIARAQDARMHAWSRWRAISAPAGLAHV